MGVPISTRWEEGTEFSNNSGEVGGLTYTTAQVCYTCMIQ